MPRRRPTAREIGPAYTFALGVLKPFCLLLTRPCWRGVENVPASGGVILAVNHISWADPVVVADMVVFGAGRAARFLAKRSLFVGRGVVPRVMRGAGQIPVDRGTESASAALADAVTALQAGECIVLYPEGTVTRDPEAWPMTAKTGVVRLALLSGAPVVPVGQWGANRLHDTYRTGRVRLVPRTSMTLVVGREVDLSAYRDRPMTAEVLRDATDEVMRAVRALTGEARGAVPPAAVFDPRGGHDDVRRAG